MSNMSSWIPCDEAHISHSTSSLPSSSTVTDAHHDHEKNLRLNGHSGLSGVAVTENNAPVTRCVSAVTHNGTAFVHILPSPLGDNVKWSTYTSKATEDCSVKETIATTEEIKIVQTPEKGHTELAVCTASKDCKRKFFDESYLHQHEKKVHKPPQGESVGLTCLFRDCGRTFQWQSHLKYHLLSHRNERAFECLHTGCGRTFLTDQRLQVHLRTHTGVKPYICTHPSCGKSFTTKGNLMNHLRVHTGEKPFVCETCSKQFAEKSTLKKHSAVHTGKKLYSCEFCKREFSQSSSLNVHLKKSHLEEMTLKQSTKSTSDQQVTDITVPSSTNSPQIQDTSTSCVDATVNPSKSYAIPLLPNSNPGTPFTLLSQNSDQKMDGTSEQQVDEYHVLNTEDKLQSEDMREHYLDFENCILTTRDKLATDLVVTIPGKTEANVVVLSQPKHYPITGQHALTDMDTPYKTNSSSYCEQPQLHDIDQTEIMTIKAQ